MSWRGEADGCSVCDGCTQGLGVVFDFMFLFVELVFAQEIVDGFIILRVYVSID